MTPDSEEKFEVSCIGSMYRKSLTLFAHHLEDEKGHPVDPDQLAPGQRFYVFFSSGTGLTRTSARKAG